MIPDPGGVDPFWQERATDEWSDAIVAAVIVADTDHDDARGRCHLRSTRSVRKWVAHEMHGS